MMNILPVVFRQICQLLSLNFSKGHTFLEILLPNLLPLWTLVLENMNLFSVQFRKGNNLSWGPCIFASCEAMQILSTAFICKKWSYSILALAALFFA